MDVILLDSSDDIPLVTRTEALRHLLDFAESLPDNALLEIRALDPKFASGRVLFSLCNPGDGRGLSEFDANPNLAKKRWRERFQKPLNQALSDGFSPGRTNSSPILSTLQSIALEKFAGVSVERLKKRLIIVSDLIEHSPPGYSQYSSDLRYERFRQLPIYKNVRTDLHGAEVEFFYIQRRTQRNIDSGAHIQFWIDWTRDCNGRFINARKLQGVGS